LYKNPGKSRRIEMKNEMKNEFMYNGYKCTAARIGNGRINYWFIDRSGHKAWMTMSFVTFVEKCNANVIFPVPDSQTDEA